MSTRDFRSIQKLLVSTIVEIKNRNRAVKIEDICKALECEIGTIRALGTEYLAYFNEASVKIKPKSLVTTSPQIASSTAFEEPSPETQESEESEEEEELEIDVELEPSPPSKRRDDWIDRTNPEEDYFHVTVWAAEDFSHADY